MAADSTPSPTGSATPSHGPGAGLSSQHRQLAGLLAANQAIVSGVHLTTVLRHIVQAACDLVDARYAALGVLAPEGGLSDFITVGIDDATAARIGHLPYGKGLLGALIDDPRPIRLAAISNDPRSVGMPPGHPEMRAFLGVPIRVRETVFGNLYLTRDDEREFSEDDVQLVASLAAVAGITIENARLFDEARRRQDWLEAATEVTRQLMARDGDDPLLVIARRVQQIASADAVTVVLPTGDGRQMIEVATGDGAAQLLGFSGPSDGTACDAVVATGEPLLIADVRSEPPLLTRPPGAPAVGPAMALPLGTVPRVRGALVILRRPGRERFSDGDLAMAATFAIQATLALELADARADQQRMALLEDRDRIARDLHDHVIQRLFAAGLTVESVAARLGTDDRAERLTHVVGELDATIRQIRDSIFQLRGPLVPGIGRLRTRIFDLVVETSPALGFEPHVSFVGPVDSVTSAGVIDDLVAVIREALTNVGRHAAASAASVEVTTAGDALTVVVTDDGVGLDDSRDRSGLANLQLRAERRGGSFTVISPVPPVDSEPKGTRLRWSIPLR